VWHASCPSQQQQQLAARLVADAVLHHVCTLRQALLLATLERLEGVEAVVQQADATSAAMEDKVGCDTAVWSS
jgi:hypothetical protein